MNWKQVSFMVGIAFLALVLPVPFSVGMFMMGMAIGGFVVVILE